MENEQILAIPVTVDKDHIVTIGERLYGGDKIWSRSWRDSYCNK